MSEEAERGRGSGRSRRDDGAKEIVRTAEGKFVKGVSGNPVGRPKGSKNKITLLKLAGEEAVRENNFEKMMEVCNQIIDRALEGDHASAKMVWEAVVSKGVQKDEQAKTQQKIQIETVAVHQHSEPKPPTYIEAEVHDEE